MPDDRDLISLFSHIFKTPLTSIKAANGLLQKRLAAKLDPQDRDLLDVMKRNTSILERRITRMLDAMTAEDDCIRLFLTGKELEQIHALKEGGSEDIQVILPVEQAAPAPVIAAPVQAKKPDMKGKTILVADDTEDIRIVVASALRDEGYHVEEAKDGKTAWYIIANYMPQLLILDGLMPMRNGFDLAKEAKEYDPEKYKPKTILMTAIYKKRHYETEAKSKFGVDVYLVKPFEMPVLLDHVRRLLY